MTAWYPPKGEPKPIKMFTVTTSVFEIGHEDTRQLRLIMDIDLPCHLQDSETRAKVMGLLLDEAEEALERYTPDGPLMGEVKGV